MRPTSRQILATAVAFSAALAIAACSGSSSSRPASSGSAGDVTIGVIGDFSGNVASTSAAKPQVVQAWADTVNAKGGLDGHQVHLVTTDVGTTTGAGLRAAQQLITQDHALAILDFNSTDNTWITYAATKGVPVIVGNSTVGSLLTPDAFPVVPSVFTTAYAFAAMSKAYGGKLGIGYCAESPTCGQGLSLIQTFGGPLGVKMAVAAKLSASSPDYTAFCQQLKDAGVTSYWTAVDSATSAKISDQCYQQGVHVPLLLNGGDAIAKWKTDPAYEDASVYDIAAPYFDTAIPAVRAYREVLAKTTSGVVGTTLDNTATEAAWAAGQLLSAAAPKVSGALTAASLKDALYSLHGETLGGLTAPLTYNRSKPTSVNCYFVWKVSGGQFAEPDSAPQCAPDSAIAPVVAAVLK
jgi:branched-chain amino acid transport system substrate-binding protein